MLEKRRHSHTRTPKTRRKNTQEKRTPDDDSSDAETDRPLREVTALSLTLTQRKHDPKT